MVTEVASRFSEIPRRSPRVLASAIAIGGFLTPLAAFMFFRLAYNGIVAVYVLWLPWPEPWPLVVRILCAVFIVFVGWLVICGLRTRGAPRVAAIVVVAYLVVSVIPVFLVLFVTSFGDPGPA